MILAVIITACHVCSDQDCRICALKTIFTVAGMFVFFFFRAVFSKNETKRPARRRNFALATVRMDL